ncbi:DUF1206 domain-containing protein [Planctomonas psychrotolerans]|uniref:DUF1206 domain-containing protein n=1 Tax=Planctomonas psychrotolerans TaxID=2528712 RepID=UPI00123A2461|nr:DUF1206 domain-containing protein [Planctomonas psychrotolerans]
MTNPRGAARQAQSSDAFEMLARLGYAVNGLLHLIIGAIAITIATTAGGGSADQSGALGRLASTPGGGFLLWVVVVGLAALGLWQITQVFRVSDPDTKKAWGKRAKEAGKAVAYLAIAVTAFRFATGGSSSSSGDTQSLSAQLLGTPGGVILLFLVGLGVVAVGLYFIYKGATKKFLEDIRTPSGTVGSATERLGQAGYIAKGIAVAVVGVLFGVAAVTTDPAEATGLDGALRSLAELPFGTAILVAVGIGLVAYGVYCFVRARTARL